MPKTLHEVLRVCSRERYGPFGVESQTFVGAHAGCDPSHGEDGCRWWAYAPVKPIDVRVITR